MSIRSILGEVSHVTGMVSIRTSQAQLMSSTRTKEKNLIRWNDLLMSEPSTLYSGTKSKREQILHRHCE